MSKTLDSASAQFAASALVSTDQLLTLKTKEEGVLGTGVNGVLSPSGRTTTLPSPEVAQEALVALATAGN